MLNEFFITFVGSVYRMKERLWIGGMNEHGDTEAAAFFPYRIEPGIIDGDQFAGLVADPKTEILKKFEAASAAVHRVPDLRRHLRAKLGVVDFAPV